MIRAIELLILEIGSILNPQLLLTLAGLTLLAATFGWMVTSRERTELASLIRGMSETEREIEPLLEAKGGSTLLEQYMESGPTPLSRIVGMGITSSNLKDDERVMRARSRIFSYQDSYNDLTSKITKVSSVPMSLISSFLAFLSAGLLSFGLITLKGGEFLSMILFGYQEFAFFSALILLAYAALRMRGLIR